VEENKEILFLSLPVCRKLTVYTLSITEFTDHNWSGHATSSSVYE
jgi:hypothetical protein